jgi:hypothetical protein
MKRLLYLIPILLLAATRPAPIHLHTTWNGHGAGALDTTTARAVLLTPLKVTDDKGTEYTITRFRFSYRQNSAFQDSSGNIVRNSQLFTRDYFNTNLVDSTWSRIISFELQPGEAFTVDGVVVKDAKGAKMLAPNLELTIQ